MIYVNIIVLIAKLVGGGGFVTGLNGVTVSFGVKGGNDSFYLIVFNFYFI